MKWIFFDCDSTLSAIEGIDELARLRPPAVFEEIVSLTDRAMNGEIPLDQIFGARLDVIRPTREECELVGRLYVEKVEPTAAATIRQLRETGWTPVIISGGYVQPIRPLAAYLGVDRIEAVELQFAEDGSYAGFDASHPNTRNGGKPEVIQRLRAKHGFQRAVMVGDGISDLEAKPEVDLFIAFGGYTNRPKVRDQADAFAATLSDILPLVEEAV